MKLYLSIFLLFILSGLHAQRQSDLLVSFVPGLSKTASPETENYLKHRNFDSWYSKQKRMPVFCQIESQIEKNTHIPVRIRMGSLNYVNYLENKYNNSYFYRVN